MVNLRFALDGEVKNQGRAAVVALCSYVGSLSSRSVSPLRCTHEYWGILFSGEGTGKNIKGLVSLPSGGILPFFLNDGFLHLSSNGLQIENVVYSEVEVWFYISENHAYNKWWCLSDPRQ